MEKSEALILVSNIHSDIEKLKENQLYKAVSFENQYNDLLKKLETLHNEIKNSQE